MNPLQLVGAIVVLVSTQMIMLIYTKRATGAARLPLLLCFAQFLTSTVLAGAYKALRSTPRFALPWAPRSLWRVLGALSAVWTGGFVLFNASASLMSPGFVNMVRCMEPLATVAVGAAMGARYSGSVLLTLLPVCGGVMLACGAGGALSVPGVLLALASNVSFSGRPFFVQRLKALQQASAAADDDDDNGNGNNSNGNGKLDKTAEFFNVTFASILMLPAAMVLLEGPVDVMAPALQRLAREGRLGTFVCDVALSSLFFFLYQLSQMVIMSRLPPLAFSVLTPVVKSFMIVGCALVFGDTFTAWSALGVGVSASGGYLFSRAMAAEKKRAAEAAAKQQ